MLNVECFFFVLLGWLSSFLEPEGRDSTFKRFTRKLLVYFPILGFSVRFSQGSHQENGETSILHFTLAEILVLIKVVNVFKQNLNVISSNRGMVYFYWTDAFDRSISKFKRPSQFVHLKKFSLKFSSSSFVIRVNLLHS